MARTRATRQVYADLLARYGQEVADAFYQALDTIRSGVEVQRITAALANGNIEGAIEALHLDPQAFNGIVDKLREAYSEGGRVTADFMPKRLPSGAALIVRFDGRNLAAEAWLSRHSSELITRITTEQLQSVRAALTESMRRGVNPRQAALEIVGRISDASHCPLCFGDFQLGSRASIRSLATAENKRDVEGISARRRSSIGSRPSAKMRRATSAAARASARPTTSRLPRPISRRFL